MITSSSNQKIKQICNWQRSAKDRRKDHIFLVEGVKMVQEAPGDLLQEIYYTEGVHARYGISPEEIASKGSGVFCEAVTEELFKKMSDTQSPQGILAVLKQPDYSLEKVLADERDGKRIMPLLLVLEDLQDPGNLGTILRTAEGAGVTGIIMTRETVDLFNPKVIRSTMGSIYRMPFYVLSKDETMSDLLDRLREKGIATYAAHLEDSRDYDVCDFTKPSAFLIGNEGNGLRRETADAADMYLKIPMEGSVESLNAAIATSVLIYEAHRQRKHQRG